MSEKAENNFLIYGAYGYTGELITRLAVSRGLKPVIAGRNEAKLKKLAGELDLPYQSFDLSEKDKLRDALKKVKVVLHCAGPFKHTYKTMVNACLATQTNYVDITGEIEVFEGCAAMSEKAKAAGITLMPGAGFDVVPSDCLAAYLKQQLPDAENLLLSFKSKGRMSRGTSLTVVENLGEGGAVRKNGKLKSVPDAYKTKEIDYGDGPTLSATIPWGDVSTAYYSTGIPNIEVYTAMSPKMVRGMKLGNWFSWLVKTSFVKNYLRKKVRSGKPGPDKEERERGYVKLYGEVTNKSGDKKAARLHCPSGYSITSETALQITRNILNGNFKPGFQTPSNAFGADFILEFEGVEREDV